MIPNLLRLSGLAALACTASLTAQGLQISGEARTAIGVFAESSPTPASHRVAIQGTKFGSALQVYTTSGTSSSQAVASIASGTARFVVTNVAGGTSYSTARVFSDPATLQGAPTVRFTFRSATKVSGRIVAVMRPFMRGFTWGSVATSEAYVTVGNNTGEADSRFDTEVVREFAADLDSTGTDVDVRVQSSGSAKTPLTFGMTVELSFVPGHRITAYGNTCAHLHTTFPSKHEIDLHVTAALPSAATVLALGSRRIDVPLPGQPACRLLLDPTIVVLGPPTDQDGRAALRLVLPNVEFRILAQAGALLPMPGMMQSTNALDLHIMKR